jgi:hypothetical protein
MGEFPTVYKLGNVTVTFWLNESGEFLIEVMHVDNDGIESTELRTGDLLNAAMLLRRVEGSLFQTRPI